MAFTVTQCPIAGLYELTPKVFGDSRGYFFESWSERDFHEAGLDMHFVQDNQSKSSRGVLRGLHFQKTHPQGKLVHVIDGEVFDVAVDIRPGSPTFGKWHGVTLTAEKQNQFYISPGFAHGFLVLSDTAIFTYKCTEFYHPEDEGGLMWNDPSIGIKWPDIGIEPLLSEKDKKHPGLTAQGGNAMIWLIGNKGMLGTELSNMLSSRALACIGTDRDVDITDPEALASFAAARASEGNPVDVIINCAAYTAVDKAEDDIELCRRLNADGPANIAACAKKIGAKLIHISTDYVFHGDGTRPYREDDPTDPTGVYGLTKRDGEIAALAANPATWIIRTAWLYGKHGNNFVFTMLKLMKEQDSRSVVNDQRGTPTWAFDLCNAICAFIEQYRAGSPAPYGIYHFSDKGNISWFDFAQEIYKKGRALGLLTKDFTVHPCTSDQFPAKVRRPPYSVLDKSKIESTLGITIPEWDASLEAFLKSTM